MSNSQISLRLIQILSNTKKSTKYKLKVLLYYIEIIMNVWYDWLIKDALFIVTPVILKLPDGAWWPVCHSYTPCRTDWFLLENPLSNSQVTKWIHTMVYLLKLWYNRAFSTESTLERQLAYKQNPLIYQSLPIFTVSSS